MFFSGKSKKELELKVEQQMKDAYKSGEIIRCYNLMKLMVKINPKNPYLMKYVNKIDEEKIKKARIKWALGNSTFFIFLKDPKLYFSILMFFVFNKIGK